eukprot:4597879-Amphidinium_carterae.1
MASVHFRMNFLINCGFKLNMLSPTVRGDVLGTGSLGVVFKALDQRTGEIFAVKEVHIDHKAARTSGSEPP